MQSVMSFVVVQWDVGSHVIDGEGAILNTVGVAADYGTVVSVVSLGVLKVSGAIVVAEDDVLCFAVVVIDEEFG